ncbi:MAG: FtsW/RodA/SpoVE family cell cycle protein, partial [Pseudomonadales bacterium]|nr:FtsW/RodA/SpoVE family cell cycle protein [Pseudomonadales bacterium]
MSLAQRWRLLRNMNWLMTAAILARVTIGIMFIYSACYVRDDRPMRDLYQRQIYWAVAGFGAYLFFALTDYRHWRRWAWGGYAASLVLLVVVLIVGTKIYGARRWLMVGPIGLQPSERAKLAVIFVLARRLSRPGENLGHLSPLLEVLTLVGLPCLLIMKEPDLGSALVLAPVTLAMMFVAGVPYRVLGLMALAGVVVGALALSMLFLPQAIGMSEAHQQTFMKAVGLSAYHRDRVMTFLDADRDPLGAGWNKRQSEIAVGSGGLSGKGYLKGTQNVLGFLPRSV